MTILTLGISATFVALSLLHLFWACGGRLGVGAAVPQVDGAAAFTPSRAATLAVAIALLGAGLSVAAAGGVLPLPLPAWVVTGSALLLALVLAARAIGDFGLVGFFKRRGEGRFARLDTLFYSPLCALLAGGILLVAISG